MNNRNNLYKLIKIINVNNLQENIFLIGSWCEIFYESYFTDYKSSMKTLDFDFYIPNNRKLANKINLIDILEENDFYVDVDLLTGKTVFRSLDRNEIEFLTGLTRNQESPIPIQELNIVAESLSRLDIFNNHYMTVTHSNYTINIPTPSAYVLHKLIVNPKRKEDKKAKDIVAIKAILEKIKVNISDFEELKEIYNSRLIGKKGRHIIDEVCKNNDITLFE